VRPCYLRRLGMLSLAVVRTHICVTIHLHRGRKSPPSGSASLRRSGTRRSRPAPCIGYHDRLHYR
jgi:hypothetical protein